jgi:Fe-S cluster assembly protein SufD
MSLARAIETGELAELPSRRDEDWRWTDFRGLVRTLPDAAPAFEAELPPGPFSEAGVETIDIVNGRGHAGLAVAPGDPRTVAVRFVAVDPGAQTSRFAIEVGPGAQLTLLESHEGGAVSETDIEIAVATGARVERIVIADAGEAGISVVQASVELAPGADYRQTIVTSGARRQRLETRVAHPGGGATVKLDSVYVIAGRNHGDLTTVVVHRGPDGETEQVTKGVAAEQGRGVFQGRIEVRPGADRTDARMQHHALVLSDRAEVDAKPELEIYADDVACSHGNSIGALDEEALFYVRQRGLSEDAARALLTDAFLGEVVDRIGHETGREVVRRFVAAQTERLA